MGATQIQEDLTIEGTLLAKDGEVTIMGRVKGDVVAKKVEILSKGTVNGAVNAAEVTVSGFLDGSVTCGTLALEEEAEVEADVTAETMKMSSGAKISGRIKAQGG